MLIYLLSSFILSVTTGIILLNKERNYYSYYITKLSLISAFDVPSLLAQINNSNQDESTKETSILDSLFTDFNLVENEDLVIMRNYEETKAIMRYTSITERMTVITAH